MHLSQRAPWLRAAVLGANDGLLSIGALLVGVAAADVSRGFVVTAGLAATAAGAFSMAVGEYSSVSSQRDVEIADLQRERLELADDPVAEERELAMIYRRRGLSRELAARVAAELSAKPTSELVAIHARDELGLDVTALANPLQAALASAAAFLAGSVIPIAVALLAGVSLRVPLLYLSTLTGLAVLGAVGAWAGGAPKGRAALRVAVGGALAMAATGLVGLVTGNAVA
jgi:VIT1/CCC1 family predicted Fe2+/Mn2+ transporter